MSRLAFLTPELCAAVVDRFIAESDITGKLERREYGELKTGFVIGIFDCTGVYDLEVATRRASSLKIFLKVVGRVGENQGKLEKNICDKMILSWRTGKSLDDLHADAPHLLRDGDIVWKGAANYEGIVVAVSGLLQADDQKIAQDNLERLIRASKEAFTAYKLSEGQRVF